MAEEPHWIRPKAHLVQHCVSHSGCIRCLTTFEVVQIRVDSLGLLLQLVQQQPADPSDPSDVTDPSDPDGPRDSRCHSSSDVIL